MEEYNILRMQDRLKEYLTRDRFIHTQGVMYTATALAMCHGEDLVKSPGGRPSSRLCQMHSHREEAQDL